MDESHWQPIGAQDSPRGAMVFVVLEILLFTVPRYTYPKLYCIYRHHLIETGVCCVVNTRAPIGGPGGNARHTISGKKSDEEGDSVVSVCSKSQTGTVASSSSPMEKTVAQETGS